MTGTQQPTYRPTTIWHIDRGNAYKIDGVVEVHPDGSTGLFAGHWFAHNQPTTLILHPDQYSEAM